MEKFLNRKSSRLIFLLVLFLLVLMYYLRKRGEERIIPAFDDTPRKNPSEQSSVKKPIDSHTFQNSQNGDKNPFPEKTPDPLADLEPSTPVLAMLYGKVKNREGHPLPGARVIVRTNNSFFYAPEDIAIAQTDKQGQYRIDGLPVLTLQVLAIKSGYYLQYDEVHFLPMQLSTEKNFEMTPGGLALAGSVQDSEDNPVENASLLLYIPGSKFFLLEKSDEKGEFRFEGLWKSFGNLSVTATGFLGWYQNDVSIGREDIRVVLSDERGIKIKGYVRNAVSKDPVSYATIVVNPESAKILGGACFTAKADKKGLYEIGPFSKGRYKIFSFNEIREGEWDNSKMIELAEGGPDEIWVDLFLPECADIRGMVLDSQNNAPIEGAFVNTGGGTTGMIQFPDSYTVQTDQNGRFHIRSNVHNITEGWVDLRAQAPGYVENYQHIKEVWKNPPFVIIKLKKGIRIHGTIYSVAGEPVPNVFVEILGAYIYNIQTDHPTDIHGKYEVFLKSDVIGQKINIRAYSPEQGFGTDTLFIPESTQDLSRDLTLSPGVSVTVYVLDKEGNGIKDCSIAAGTRGEKGRIFYHSLKTDVEGKTVFENLPGDVFKFSAYNENIGMEKEKSLDLAMAQGPQEIVFSSDDPEEVLIHGIVTDEARGPLQNVRVSCLKPSRYYEITTNAEGRYRIEISAPLDLSYDITFSKDGYYVKELQGSIPEKKEVELDAVLIKMAPVIFFGTIVTSKGDIPQEADLQVVMRREDSTIHRADLKRTNLKQGGVFEINSDPIYYYGAKSYFIDAQHPIYGSGRSQEISPNGNNRIGPFDIVLSWGTLKGYVRDAKTGNPVSNVLISNLEIKKFHFPDQRELCIYTRSNENGYCELYPLACGSHDIYFYHSDYYIQKQTSPEVSQECLELEWNPLLDPCASIEGRIFNCDGTPLSNVGIFINGLDKCLYNNYSYTDDQGQYSIYGLPPGEYTLDNSMEPYGLFNKYGYSMARNVKIAEPEKIKLDIHVPKRVAVLLQMKQDNGIYLEPLYPAEYNKLCVNFQGVSPNVDNIHNILLPPGRYLLRPVMWDKPPKEIEILPTGENRIIIEDEK